MPLPGRGSPLSIRRCPVNGCFKPPSGTLSSCPFNTKQCPFNTKHATSRQHAKTCQTCHKQANNFKVLGFLLVGAFGLFLPTNKIRSTQTRLKHFRARIRIQHPPFRGFNFHNLGFFFGAFLSTLHSPFQKAETTTPPKALKIRTRNPSAMSTRGFGPPSSPRGPTTRCSLHSGASRLMFPSQKVSMPQQVKHAKLKPLHAKVPCHSKSRTCTKQGTANCFLGFRLSGKIASRPFVFDKQLTSPEEPGETNCSNLGAGSPTQLSSLLHWQRSMQALDWVESAVGTSSALAKRTIGFPALEAQNAE